MKKKDSEKKIERLLVDESKRIGGWALKLVPDFFSGLPDRLCLFPGGRLFFIETKSTKDKPRKLQKIIHKRLLDMGFKVLVIDTINQVNKFIEHVEQR